MPTINKAYRGGWQCVTCPTGGEPKNLVLQMLEQITDQPKSGINPAIASKDRTKPLYSVTQVPSWYLCVFLAVQVSLVPFSKVGKIVTRPVTAAFRTFETAVRKIQCKFQSAVAATRSTCSCSLPSNKAELGRRHA